MKKKIHPLEKTNLKSHQTKRSNDHKKHEPSINNKMSKNQTKSKKHDKEKKLNHYATTEGKKSKTCSNNFNKKRENNTNQIVKKIKK